MISIGDNVNISEGIEIQVDTSKLEMYIIYNTSDGEQYKATLPIVQL